MQFPYMWDWAEESTATRLLDASSHGEATGAAALGECALYRWYRTADGWVFVASKWMDRTPLSVLQSLMAIDHVPETNDELSAALEVEFRSISSDTVVRRVRCATDQVLFYTR